MTQVGAPHAGTALEGRYRLDALSEDLGDPGRVLWHGTDIVLARPVTIEILVPGGPAAEGFLAEAIAASRVVHPAVIGVYDAVDATDHAYVVRQRIDGTVLADEIRSHPMSPERAASFARSAAEGLEAIHAAGYCHGNLNPATTFVTRDGSTVLKGLRTSQDDDPREDLRALGGILYATLTGRWPAELPSPDLGLADAVRDDGRICSPRQIRAGIPSYLDGLTMELLAGTSRSAAEVASELRRVEVEEHPELDADHASDGGPRRSLWLVVGAPTLALALVVLAGWLVGTRGLQVGTNSGYPTTQTPSEERSSPAAAPALQSFTPVHARILDPGGDGTELANASRAIDRRPDSGWSSAVYHGDPHFGRIPGKTGMGIAIDLGAPHAVRTITVTVSGVGSAFELRTGSTDSSDPAAYRTVASQSDAPATVTLTLPEITSRYWLVWITALPEVAPGRYGISVKEISFAGPASAG